MWWLDHNKPYPGLYMACISLWLSLTGLLETMGASDFKLPRPCLRHRQLDDQTVTLQFDRSYEGETFMLSANA